jgi:hypothetical protein
VGEKIMAEICMSKYNIHDFCDSTLEIISAIHRNINQLKNKQEKQMLRFEANEMQNHIANIKEIILK